MTHRHDNPGRMTRRAVLAAMAGGVTTLVGCGGGAGGDEAGGGGITAGPVEARSATGASIAGISSGGTGSYAEGSVTGLGSIIVRGIRYDDRAATIERDDDGIVGILRPGMVVSVSGSSIAPALDADGLPVATAIRIRYGSEWVGKVDAVDTVNRTLTVLGQGIDVAANAVFDGDAMQLSAVTTSHYVEAHGFLDLSTGRLLATRLEVSTTAPSAFRLSGQVNGLDAAARTFAVGTAQIAYDAALVLPDGWANGQMLRVTLATSPDGSTWQATRIRQRESSLPGLEVQDRSDAQVEGTVTSIGAANTFTVNGVAIDATGVPIVGTLLLGATVQVGGTAVDGVIAANWVEVKPRAEVEAQDFQFLGEVSNLDILARTFTVKGVDFAYDLSTRIDVLGWVIGATPLVRVKATQVNGVWVASRIKQR